MSTFATCLLEFLLFLGIPYLRALKQLILAAITQLEIAKAEALASLAFMDGANQGSTIAMGIAQLIVDEVRNVLGSMPLGTFRECEDVSKMIGLIRDSFDKVFEYFDNASNQSNRVRAFSSSKAALSQELDEDIQYLRELADQIDIAIIELLRREAAAL